MRKTGTFFFASVAILALCCTWAQGPSLVVQDAWIRATPGSDVAAAYFSVQNTSTRPVTITDVSTPVAGHAMIHESSIVQGQSRMRPLDKLMIEPGKTVKLEPGKMHVMLHGLTQPLTAGRSVPLTLTTESGEKIQVTAQVRPLGAP